MTATAGIRTPRMPETGPPARARRTFAAMRTVLSTAGLALFLVACGAVPSATAKLQEASQEMNVNTRFGRMEMAVEKVAVKEREEWARRHKMWGGKIRIADTEMAGTRLTSETEADVNVKVAWYRNDEQELRVTTIKQKWKDVNGEWRLVGEVRMDGDAGLLGDVGMLAPDGAGAGAPSGAPAKRKVFPTIRIGGNDADGDPQD